MNPETVKNYFDNPLVVADYAYAAENVGLWNSERIVFEKYIPKSSKIIEFGCGAGRISLGLSALGYGNITATDFAPKMVEAAAEIFARHNADIETFVCDATDTRLKDTSFDAAIFGFNGLMQIPKSAQRRRAIGEICRILKPGGIFAFTTHDRDAKRNANYWENKKNNGSLTPNSRYSTTLATSSTRANTEIYLSTHLLAKKLSLRFRRQASTRYFPPYARKSRKNRSACGISRTTAYSGAQKKRLNLKNEEIRHSDNGIAICKYFWGAAIPRGSLFESKKVAEYDDGCCNEKFGAAQQGINEAACPARFRPRNRGRKGARALHRAHGIQWYNPFPRGKYGRIFPKARNGFRGRYKRPYELHRNRL